MNLNQISKQMKTKLNKLLLAVVIIAFTACQQQPGAPSDEVQTADINAFLGHWSFDIDGNWVGWLGVSQEDGYLDAELLWKWGSVTPVASVYLNADNTLRVTRVRNVRRAATSDDAEPRRHMFTDWVDARVDGDRISGYFMEPRANGLGVDSTWFSGVKLPPVPTAPDLSTVTFGEPIELFNGTDLTGWRPVNENQANGFTVVDGVMYNDVERKPGEDVINYGNLRTEQEFEDFNLTLEVMVPQGSNSGVYLRGIYEIQVLDSYGREPNSHHMGGVYSRIAPKVNAEKPAGQWQTMDMTLVDRHITVILNGVKIIDNQPVYGPTGGALSSDVLAPGPIYLQGDHGPVSYRNMVLRPVVR
jgi:hypothetical protein